MKLTIDRNWNDVQVCSWNLVRGECERLEVAFEGKVPDDAVLTFAAKEAGNDAGFVLFCDGFERVGDLFCAVVSLDTVELNGLFADEDRVTLMAELRLETGRVVQKFILRMVVRNDVIKGTEGLPVPAPEYVTKVYLEEELRKHTVVMEGLRDAAQDAAGDAADSAMAAAGSEALAGKWAENPKDEPVTGTGVAAKYSALHWAYYGKQYAQEAFDSAALARAWAEGEGDPDPSDGDQVSQSSKKWALDSRDYSEYAYNQAVASSRHANSSSKSAQIAAELVASVTDVSEQVTAAQNAAATAASKATEATNSATAADNSATAADSSKKAATTSASNAKASETNAANSAKSAADSKTACENILSQMQGLLKNVPLLDADNIFTGTNTMPVLQLVEGETAQHKFRLRAYSTSVSLDRMSDPAEGWTSAAFRWDSVSLKLGAGTETEVLQKLTAKAGIVNENGIIFVPSGTPVQMGAVTEVADGSRHGWVSLLNDYGAPKIVGYSIRETGEYYVDRIRSGRLSCEGTLSMCNNKIVDVATGTANTDAATVAQAGSGGSSGVSSVNGQTGDVLLGLSSAVDAYDFVETTIVASPNTSGKTTGDPLVFGYSLALIGEAISPTGFTIDTLGTAITTENAGEYVVTPGNIANYSVTALGGRRGALGIGTNLSFSGNTLNASGGGGTLPDNVITTSNIGSYAVTRIGNVKGAISAGNGISVTAGVLRVDLSGYTGDVSVTDVNAGADFIFRVMQGSQPSIFLGNSKTAVEGFMKYLNFDMSPFYFYLGAGPSPSGKYNGGFYVEVDASPVSISGGGFDFNGKQVLTQS